MPDIGLMELLVIGIVALIVVGPKDLPKLFRSFGQFTGRMRAMARDFSRAMNEAAEESGVGDISRDLKAMSNPKQLGLDKLNKAFDGIDPDKYPEGSETRKLAEKRAADAKKIKDTAEARRAETAGAAAGMASGAQADGEAAPAPAEETAEPKDAESSA